MKSLLRRVSRRPAGLGAASLDPLVEASDFFSPEAEEAPEAASARTTWPQRAEAVAARPADREAGMVLFTALWTTDHRFNSLAPGEVERLAGHLDYARVEPDREVIAQDELGDYLLVVLEGRIAVERVRPDGVRTRLAEARPGDILGEMSLLDAGARFSSCRTLAPTTLAVMDAARLDALLQSDPRLGVALLASLSRRLSLRLRKVSARLSALLSQN